MPRFNSYKRQPQPLSPGRAWLCSLAKGLTLEQRGQALIMAVGFLFAGTALATGALSLASSTSISSRLATEAVKSQYAVMGGSEHALYRLRYEVGYADSLLAGEPGEYTTSISDRQVSVTVVKVSEPAAELTLPPPPAERGREFRVTKDVSPTSADPNVPTIYTYTITIANIDSQPHTLKSIWDRLPEGFTYVSGSSSGITSQNPTLQNGDLQWDLGPTFVDFQAQESKAQTFQAEASVGTGHYGNEAWIEPGDDKTSTGLTARITVGSPDTELWEGAHATINKTVAPAVAPAETEVTLTYTITLQSTGTDVLTLTKVKDLLPPGGLTYVPGTTSGLTTANPGTTIKSTPQGDRQQLEWYPDVSFQPGESKGLSFQVSAVLVAADYYNEAWASFAEIDVDQYTWPTARIKVMGVVEVTADDGRSVVFSRLWIGPDVAISASWQMTTR
ncbi:MAG: DUF11 domain-containing protein [Chloroflexi bacterium]|nr:DUF11 domain-containing protein [Chloroflexota bacterium]